MARSRAVYDATYRRKHHEAIAARNRQYYADHREQRRRYDREHYKQHAAAMNAKHAAYYRANPEKFAAYAAVHAALAHGELTRHPCEVCGSTERMCAHHDDYSKPLDVRWLCERHHRRLHLSLAI